MPAEPYVRESIRVYPGEGQPPVARPFKALSVFSGAMGLDIGVHQTDEFNLLAAVEKVPAFCQTIVTNRDNENIIDRSVWVYEGDISNLDVQEVMADLGVEVGELDLLIGGPPCQAFSTSGRRASVQDPRGTMLWQFLRFVDELQPKFFLMENVRGLMSASLRHRPIQLRPDKGGPPLEADEMPGSVVESFMRDMSGEYRLDIFEVNAANYGAPQIRERVLFIGNRVGHVVEFPEPTHGVAESAPSEAGLFEAGAGGGGLIPFASLRDAIDDLDDPDPIVLDFSPRKKHYLSMVPPGSNWRSLPPEVAEESMGRAYHAKGGRSGWWRRLTLDLPCPTIVTMPNHASTALCHPTETRALSLRECARVQEFPDTWQFVGKTAEQYAQVGNAVPVRLGAVAGEVLADHLRAALNGDDAKFAASAETPRVRQVYLKSHIRTRRWFKAGETLNWSDGADENVAATYGAAKTLRTERSR